MVTPETGVITFRGLNTGRTYSLSFYSSDVVGANMTFNSNGIAVAGSQTFWNTPEDVIVDDISIITGMTVTTTGMFMVNDVSTGNIFAIANIINTLAYRNFPHISIARGKKFTIIQA